MKKAFIPCLDFILATSVWLAAVLARVWLTEENAPDFTEYIKYGMLIGALTVFFFSRFGLYDHWHFRSRLQEVTATIRATLAAELGFIVLSYFFAANRISRGTLVLYAAVACFAFLIERFSLRELFRRSIFSINQKSRVVLVGDGEPLRDYVATLSNHPHLNIELSGWIDQPAWSESLGLAPSIFDGTTRSNDAAYVVSYTSENSNQVDRFLKENYNDVTKIFVLPDLKSYALLGLHLQDFAGLPILLLNQPSWSPFELAAKRTLDFLGAFVGLLMLLIPLAVIGALVKLTSHGPIFFGQERMGLDGCTFKMWKFRSMKVGDASPGWTVENDPRRTRIGTFLRSTSIDELPQLWNVLVGDMSLVGPRPEQPFYVQSFRDQIPAYMLRHKMKAGITGWAQVNGWRGDTSLHRRIECDLFYIRNWSFVLDLKILFLTLWNGFINKNAY